MFSFYGFNFKFRYFGASLDCVQQFSFIYHMLQLIV